MSQHHFPVEITLSDTHMPSEKTVTSVKCTLIYVEVGTGRKKQGEDTRRIKYALIIGI